MNKTGQLDNLFIEWKKPYTDFAEDGIINEELWNTAKRKVLFLLKEPNKPIGNLREFIDEGGGPWLNVSYWNYALQNVTRLSIPDFRETKENYKDSCKAIAIVNLKKTSGGNKANHEEVKQFAEADKEFIEEEIRIISPEIIVCGGTWEICNQIWNNHKPISKHIYRIPNFGNIIWIDFFHPAYWGMEYEKLYYNLSGYFQDYLNKKETY